MPELRSGLPGLRLTACGPLCSDPPSGPPARPVASPAFAGQADVRAPDAEELSIQAFLQAVETSISTMDRQRWIDLLSPLADRDQSLEFFDAMVPQGITRVVVKERDRSPLFGALPGEGYRLVTEVFMETGPRGRIATWRLDIRRPRGEDIGPQPWRIVSEDRLSSVEGLHRLVAPSRPPVHRAQPGRARRRLRAAAARGRRLRRRDAGRRHRARPPRRGHDGVPARAEGGARTAEDLLPASRRSRRPFTAAFVRLNPFEFEQTIAAGMLEPVDARPARLPARAGGVRRRGGQVVQPRPERPEPRYVVAAAAAGRFRRRGAHAAVRRDHLRARGRRARGRHDVPARRASATSRRTPRRRSSRAAAASTTRTTSPSTT